MSVITLSVFPAAVSTFDKASSLKGTTSIQALDTKEQNVHEDKICDDSKKSGAFKNVIAYNSRSQKVEILTLTDAGHLVSQASGKEIAAYNPINDDMVS